MKTLGLLIMIGITGCAATFQPFPGVSQKDFMAAVQQLQQNDQILAQKLAEIAPAPKPKEVAKK